MRKLKSWSEVLAWMGHRKGGGEKYLDLGYILKEPKGIVNEWNIRYVREELRMM